MIMAFSQLFYLLLLCTGLWTVATSNEAQEYGDKSNNENKFGKYQGFSPSKTSFLFILVDDIGWADFGYNNGTAHTSNIDAWVQRKGSIKFQDFHSGGTVCSPTRATVLTGRNHFRDCVDYVYGCSDMRSCVPDFEFAPAKTFTVGDAIRAVPGDDYEDGSFFAGKWHLGAFYNDSEAMGGKTSSPVTHGFDHFNATVEVAPTVTSNCQCRKDWMKHCNFGHYNRSNHCQPAGKCCFNYWWDDPISPHGVANLTWPTPDDDSLYLADSFSRFLMYRREEQKPFFAQISFHNCHIPFIGLQEAKDACAKGETCNLPKPGEPPYNDKELDYYACMTQLDNAVGEVLSALDDSGYYDNTMIWFTSDNGPEQNCEPTGVCKNADTDPHRPVEGPGSAGPLRGRKRDIYEGGHRVAGIVSYPAMVQDETSRESWETVVTMDFLPTVMDLLGVDRPIEQQSWAMDGRSIVPLLRNKTLRWKDTSDGPRSIGVGYYDAALAIEHGWGFRYGRWKFVEGSTSCTEKECQQPQLFDLDTDIGERHDLSKKFPHILAHLQSKFKDWHDSVMQSRHEESKCQNSRELQLPLSIQKLVDLEVL